jgi:regulator of sirC expression with transglutaminase-like and TPR domain
MAIPLPTLLRLIDDESAVVRSAVQQQLEAMGSDLWRQLGELDRPLSAREERAMASLLAPSRREELEDQWLNWRHQSTRHGQIESALGQLSAFLSGWKVRPKALSLRLDYLAGEAQKEGVVDARGLAHYLFGGRNQARFRGNTRDYYSPANSNLHWVIDTGLGNPISLCSLYRLLGARLGIVVEGCNFPSHFLAMVMHDGERWLVDCFNRGRFMLASDVARHHPAAIQGMEDVINQPASPASVILRFLRNLDDAFEKLNALPERQIMRRLAVKIMESEGRPSADER